MKPMRTGALVVMLLAGGLGEARAQGQLSPVSRRTTDEAIAADMGLMRTWQRRLVVAARAGNDDPARVYTAAKAAAWLNFARDEYQDNDRGLIVEEALREATRRIEGLERGTGSIDGTVSLPHDAIRVRADLWGRAARFREHAGFATVSADVARLEVALVRGGHGAVPGASCVSAPYLRMADSLANHIDSVLAARPVAPEPVLVPDVPVAAPPPPPPPPRDTDGDGVPDSVDCCPNSAIGVRVDGSGCEPLAAENVPLVLDGVVFASARAVILPSSRTILDRVAASLVSRPEVLIEVGGHTDSRADSAYNHRLSAARAAAVRDYLVARGVSGERIISHGYGEDRPRAENASEAGRALNRRVELLWRRPARAGNRTACGALAAPDTFAIFLPTAEAPAMVLEGVEFLLGSATLAPSSRAVLDRVAAGLVAHPEVSLQVGGHTDNAGAASANRALSLARAQAVRTYLVARGVQPERLEARGFGPDRPRESNATAAGQARNRRVELRLLAQARAEDAAPVAAPAAPATPEAAPPVTVNMRHGDTLVVDGPEFSTGRLVLSPRNRALLDGIAAWMRRTPSADLRILGHTDNEEGPGVAVSRSAQWANTVRLYLVSKGVEPWRMADYAIGSDRPRASNSTPEGRARNRRVEIARD